LLNLSLRHFKNLLLNHDNNHHIHNNINQQQIEAPEEQEEEESHDAEFLKEVKDKLQDFKYNEDILQKIWKTILTISNDKGMEITKNFIQALHNYVTTQLGKYPLMEPSIKLRQLLQQTDSPTIDSSIEIFKEYITRYEIKPLFYRLLLHPGITEEQIAEFMFQICQLARELPTVDLIAFFDEVNTSSCLGLFKEMFMDGTLHGTNIPKNIFFTAAINPFMAKNESKKIHRSDYLVHKLPRALENLKVSYGSLASETLATYIYKKIAMFQISSITNGRKSMPLEDYVQHILAECILRAQEFCEKRLGRVFVFFIQNCIEVFYNK
ncbi:unnamed protein product, partial [Rotaria sp. Silwood2]